jgi:hypothetical protein
MNKKYIVRLTAEERAHLHQMLSAGKAAARKLLHARILRHPPMRVQRDQAGQMSTSVRRWKSAPRRLGECANSLSSTVSPQRWSVVYPVDIIHDDSMARQKPI